MAERKVGTVQLYSGDGKGKTTAALGAALRAVGHGNKVVIIQFMKGRLYGELESAKKLEGLTIEQYGRDEFVNPSDPDPVDRELAMKGWARVKKFVKEKDLDVLILDEVNVAVSFGLIPLEDVVELIKRRPQKLEMILTGRFAPDELLDLADTVTEMREIKHHYRQGVKARKGIEY